VNRYLLTEEEQFLNGKCVFCGEEAEQRNYPGDGWNTYDVCECPESKAYYGKYNKYSSILMDLCQCAKARKKIMEMEIQDRELNKEIEKLKEKKRDILWEAQRKMSIIEGSNGKENNIRRKRRNFGI